MAVKLGASGRGIQKTTSLPTSGVVSVGAWIKVNSVRSFTYQYFLGFESGLTNAADWVTVGYSSDGTFEVSANQGATFQNGALRTPKTGEWELFVITNGGSGVNQLNVYQKRLYDTNLSQTSLSGTTFTPTVFAFGNDSYDEWCDVDVAFAFIYNRAITKDEVLAIANGAPLPLNGLNSYSEFITPQLFVGSGQFSTTGSGATHSYFSLPSWENIVGNMPLEYQASGAVSLTLADVSTSVVVGSFAIAQTHPLTVVNILGNQPTVDVVVISTINNLIATSPPTGPPTVGGIVLGVLHTLSVESVVAQPPTVEPSTIATANTLLLGGIESGQSVVSSCSVSQTNNLTLSQVITAQPTVSLLVIASGSEIALSAVLGGVPSIDGAALGQTHALVNQEILLGLPSVGELQLSQTHSFLPSNVESESTVDALELSAANTLLLADITSTIVVSACSLGQTHALVNQEVLSGSSGVGSLELSQVYSFSLSSIESGPVIDVIELSTANTLLLSDITSGTVVSTCLLGQTHPLITGEVIGDAPTVGQLTISQDFVFGLVTLEGGIPTVDSVNITSIYAIEPSDILSAPFVEQNSLSQIHAFLPSILVISSPSIGELGINLGELPTTKRTKVITGILRIKTVTSTQPKVKTVYSANRLHTIQ